MSDALEQSIVSLLEERVELAISTVQELRAEKLELEAEIARLNSDLLQRDAQIQTSKIVIAIFRRNLTQSVQRFRMNDQRSAKDLRA